MLLVYVCMGAAYLSIILVYNIYILKIGSWCTYVHLHVYVYIYVLYIYYNMYMYIMHMQLTQSIWPIWNRLILVVTGLCTNYIIPGPMMLGVCVCGCAAWQHCEWPTKIHNFTPSVLIMFAILVSVTFWSMACGICWFCFLLPRSVWLVDFLHVLVVTLTCT